MENSKREVVLRYARDQYGTEPEYLWQKYPGYAVLRHRENGKWYAVIMDIARDRLGLDGTEKVDVMDVKCDPILIGALRKNDGILPAYHMNKDKWIAVRLDGTAPEKEILSLLDMSYDLTGIKKK